MKSLTAVVLLSGLFFSTASTCGGQSRINHPCESNCATATGANPVRVNAAINAISQSVIATIPTAVDAINQQ